MTLVHRFIDLLGCTVVHVEGEHVVFWTGKRTLLRYRVVGAELVEAGSYTSAKVLETLEDASALAGRVSYR